MAKFRGTHVKPSPTGQTVNATPAAFDLIDLAAPGFCEAINNQGVYVVMTVLARNNSTGATAGTQIAGVAKRLAGTLTFIQAGTPTILGDAVTLGAVLLQASGTKLQALATGIAVTTINWTFHTQMWTD